MKANQMITSALCLGFFFGCGGGLWGLDIPATSNVPPSTVNRDFSTPNAANKVDPMKQRADFDKNQSLHDRDALRKDSINQPASPIQSNTSDLKSVNSTDY